MSMTTLYRMFDAQGRLLYVGISARAAMRWEQHRGEKQWWSEVARIEVEHHEDRLAALTAETTAIRRERPRFNIAGTVGGASVSAAREGGGLSDELRRPKEIGLRSLIVRWPVAERLAEQVWRVVRSPGGSWDVVVVVDGGYQDKRDAQEVLSGWADSFEESALILPEGHEPQPRKSA